MKIFELKTLLTKTPAANSTYPKGGVSCSKGSFVVNQTLVFQIKFCVKNPALRVAAKRYGQVYEQTTKRQSEQTRELPEEKFYSS